MKNEQTLVLAKADVLERGILGDILKRFENAGLKIIAAKLLKANKTLAKKHYTGSKKWKVRIGNKIINYFTELNLDLTKTLGSNDPEVLGNQVYEKSVDYLTRNPVLAMVLEGPHAIERVELMAGDTEPRKAGRGTIRGDFSTDSVVKSNMEKRAINNLIHSSKDKSSAYREMNVWFKPKDLVFYHNKFENTLY